ncbi:MAG: hypothetical protein VX505_01220 [Chloroflexota bacterium]|nr:hypothetical protein [Chloroflexota bacterium]
MHLNTTISFLGTDDMGKLRARMQPVIGYWGIVITPVMGLE